MQTVKWILTEHVGHIAVDVSFKYINDVQAFIKEHSDRDYISLKRVTTVEDDFQASLDYFTNNSVSTTNPITP